MTLMLKTALVNLLSVKKIFYCVCFVFISLPRGTCSTFGSLVPVGRPGQERNMSIITVTLLVENHLGAKVIALNK